MKWLLGPVKEILKILTLSHKLEIAATPGGWEREDSRKDPRCSEESDGSLLRNPKPRIGNQLDSLSWTFVVVSFNWFNIFSFTLKIITDSKEVAKKYKKHHYPSLSQN